MSDPHVLTFEKDIENEIRSKSASLIDIAASSGVVENKPEKNATSWVIVLLVSLAILLLGVGAYAYYLTKGNGATTPEKQKEKIVSTSVFEAVDPKTTTQNNASTSVKIVAPANANKKIITDPLSTIFPNIYPYIDKNIVKAESMNGGYIITFSGYNAVFKSVIENENLFLKDMSSLYHLEEATTTLSFTDTRVGDIDARMVTVSQQKKLYYSFIKPSSLLIADTPETLQSLAGTMPQ